MKIAPPEISTPRLRLRRLRDGDLDAFVALNADPLVMEFFPRPWSREESHDAFQRVQEGFTERGFGVYTAEVSGDFAGVVGLSVPTFQAPFIPCVEILWRLFPQFWGKGLASEAAGAVLQMAFHTLELQEVVAFTAAIHEKSIRVMERIGMKRDVAGDFDHPRVEDPRLRRHVLYRSSASQVRKKDL